MVRMQEKYEKLRPQLMKELQIKSVMAVPRITCVVLNTGVGSAGHSKQDLELAVADMTLIAGQKAVKTYAKKAIAAFKIRAGVPVGIKATLRGERMYEFLDKLFNIVLPRLRDFRGVKLNAFDGRGNYSLGLAEHLVFAEINATRITRNRSLQINILTTAQNDDAARMLLKVLGMPFEHVGES